MSYKNPMTYLVHEYGIPVRLPVQLAADVGLLQLRESTYRTVRLEPEERRTRITRAVVRMEMEAGR